MPPSVDRLAASAGHKRRCAEFVFGWIYSNAVQNPLIYVVDCCSSDYTIVDTLAVKASQAHLPSYSTTRLARTISGRCTNHPPVVPTSSCCRVWFQCSLFICLRIGRVFRPSN
ncbi:hypothetical protein J6590_091406 [Homalodisca vitripennis]|nr:hypothetical protein J6590_091406 [Homalodisca vitripennis]